MDRFLERLTDPEEAAAYINAARQDSDEMFRTAILDVARAHQISKVARSAGVTREHLYRSFSPRGNPTEATLNAVLRSIGLDRGDVKPLVRKRTPPTPSPQTAAGAKRRISRVRRAAVSEYQLAFNFERSQGLGQPTTPISRYAGEPIAATQGTAQFIVFLGNTLSPVVSLLGQIGQVTSGIENEWSPYLHAASADSITRIMEAR